MTIWLPLTVGVESLPAIVTVSPVVRRCGVLVVITVGSSALIELIVTAGRLKSAVWLVPPLAMPM